MVCKDNMSITPSRCRLYQPRKNIITGRYDDYVPWENPRASSKDTVRCPCKTNQFMTNTVPKWNQHCQTLSHQNWLKGLSGGEDKNSEMESDMKALRITNGKLELEITKLKVKYSNCKKILEKTMTENSELKLMIEGDYEDCVSSDEID